MGLSNLTGNMAVRFQATPQNNVAGAVYPPIGTSFTINPQQNLGTSVANNASGGADEVFSFQQAIAGGGSATLDLTNMTNSLAQAGVSIARLKAYLIQLLSAAQDSTITTPVASSGQVTNNGPAVPNPLDFGTLGSGLTLTIGVGSTVINSVAIGAAGSGYPPSSSFIVAPNQAGGSGAVISVTTNSSGVPTTVAVVTGGTGYSAATVPSTVLGQYPVLSGGAHSYFDPSAAGFALVGSTSKNIKLINNDGTNTATFQLSFFAGST